MPAPWPLEARPRRLLVAVGVLALFALLALVAALVTRSAPAGAAFPGANGKIAFDSDRDGNVEVYMMNADGSGQTLVVGGVADSDTQPSYQLHGGNRWFLDRRLITGNIMRPFEVIARRAGVSATVLWTDPDAKVVAQRWAKDDSFVAFLVR